MRSFAFSIAYWTFSIIFILLASLAALIPGQRAVQGVIKAYTKVIRWSMGAFAGIAHEIRGREHLPEGTYLVAAKHQSWGDGFLIYPEIEDLTFVTGDHLLKFPLIGSVLRKLRAIVIDTCGGGERKAASLAEGLERAAHSGQRILVYPEGHLAPVDHHFRYKPGIWHMYQKTNAPVVPVATNLGLYWQQEDFWKTPGTAILEFLPPIPPGLDKDTFMARLTETVETKAAALIAEGRGTPPAMATLLPDPDKGTLAKPKIIEKRQFKA